MRNPSLPPRPNLEQLRKRAKDLLRAYRDRQPDALARLRASLLRYSHLSGDDLTRAVPVIARCSACHRHRARVRELAVHAYIHRTKREEHYD